MKASKEVCKTCSGSGKYYHGSEVEDGGACPSCHGTGKEPKKVNPLTPEFSTYGACGESVRKEPKVSGEFCNNCEIFKSVRKDSKFEYLDKRLIAVERQLLEMRSPMVGLRTPDIEPPPSPEWKVCKACRGKGLIRDEEFVATTCKICNGSGVEPKNTPPPICVNCVHGCKLAQQADDCMSYKLNLSQPDSSLEQLIDTFGDISSSHLTRKDLAMAIRKWIGEKIDAIETYPSIPEKEWVSKYAVKKALLNERGRDE